MTGDFVKLDIMRKIFSIVFLVIAASALIAAQTIYADNPGQIRSDTNSPPILLFPLDTTFYEDEQLDLSNEFILASVFDADHDDSLLTISITADSGLVFYWFDRAAGIHKFWANKDIDSCGFFHIQVQDPADSILIENFIVDILPVNDAPVLQTIPDTSAIQDSTFSMSLSGLWSDVDNDSSEMEWTSSALHSVTSIYHNGDSLVCEPSVGYIGWDTLFISVKDPEGLAARDTFRVYFRDAYPPSFVIGIFQNPVASEHLDIYFFPDESIDSLYSALVNSDSLDPELLTAIDPAPFHAHYRLDNNGVQTLKITASDTSGNFGTTEYNFSSSLISKQLGGILYSPDSLARISIFSESAINDFYCLCLPNTDEIQSGYKMQNELALTKQTENLEFDVYTFLAPSTHLRKPYQITFFPKDQQLEYGIYQRSDNSWSSLETYTDSRHTSYWSYTQDLGIFTLKQNPVQPSNPVPGQFKLAQNYPNPFNSETVITYNLPEISGSGLAANVEIIIFDIRGREVDKIIRKTQSPGLHAIHWNAAHCVSGVYFYTVKAGIFQKTKKMVLLK